MGIFRCDVYASCLYGARRLGWPGRFAPCPPRCALLLYLRKTPGPPKPGAGRALVRESLHKSKPVIASAAKQSIFACQSITYGSPRRCAPRDDGLMQTFPSAATYEVRSHAYRANRSTRFRQSRLGRVFGACVVPEPRRRPKHHGLRCTRLITVGVTAVSCTT